jgi:hypothetical protein
VRVVFHASRGDGSIEAFASGVQAAGHTVAWLRPQHWSAADFDATADVVVVHGLYHGAGRAAAAYRASGVPVWIIDLPRLRSELLAIGLYLNDLQWLPPDALRAPVNSSVVTLRRPEIVLVAAQKPGDHAHDMDERQLDGWARSAVRLARGCGLPVLYRPHPRDTRSLPPDWFGADAVSLPTVALEREWPRTAVLVTHNSTAGWEAIAAGVPVHATDPAASYAEYTTRIDDLQPLSPDQRARALGRAASAQWTMYELQRPEIVEQLFAHHALEVVA